MGDEEEEEGAEGPTQARPEPPEPAVGSPPRPLPQRGRSLDRGSGVAGSRLRIEIY